MKKMYINLNIITFALLHLSFATYASEQNLTEQLKARVKNKFNNHLETIKQKHTYKYFSLERCRDLALLYCLPEQTAQEILQQQRTNMQNFLRKNEAEAFKEVRKYWNFDDATWSKIQNTIDNDLALHMNELKKDGPLNAYHNPALPAILLEITKRACDRLKLNVNNLHLDITFNPSLRAECSQKHKHLSDNTYNSTKILYNLENMNYLTQKQQKHTTQHELRHALEGHSLIKHILYNEITNKDLLKEYDPAKILQHQNTLQKEAASLQQKMAATNLEWEESSIFSYLNPFYLYDMNKRITEQNDRANDILKRKSEIIKIMQETIKFIEDYTKKLDSLKVFNDSPQGKNYFAAQEKTADTFDACIDPIAAQNAAAKTWSPGYPDNVNDMRVINANWKTSQNIAKRSKNFRKLHSRIKENLFYITIKRGAQ